MKKILISLLISIVVAGICVAGKHDSQSIKITSNYGTNYGTNSVVSTTGISGKIIAIEITVAGTAATNTVTLSTPTQTLLDAVTILSNVVYYPRIQVQGVSGTNLQYNVNAFEPVSVEQDRVTLLAVAGEKNIQTNTITARIILEN